MIEFSEDGQTVTMSVEKFKDLSMKASKNWQAEMHVLHAYIVLHPHLFNPEQVQESAEEFVHGVRQFIFDLHQLSGMVPVF